MGVRHVLVAGWLVAAVSPTTWFDLAPAPPAVPAVQAPRPDTIAKRRTPKRPAKPKITVVAAKPSLSPDHDGTAWWLREVPRIDQAFQDTFGYALPISAYGQTALHDKLGFDHRDAVDIALHPDSPEGIELQRLLREAGAPFIIARGSVRGVATGAHIHIGPPSHRQTEVALSTP